MHSLDGVSKTVLSNGIRVLSEHISYVESVSLGVWVKVGSRDERGVYNGMSHFIEHMLFKGTSTRSAKQIAVESDSVGCDLNAFTDKEYTCFHTKVLSEYLPVVLDIFSDMISNPAFEESNIASEKGVVIEEINQIDSVPEDIVHDVLARAFFGSNSLGSPVIGEQKRIEAFTQKDIIDYMNMFYCPDNIIISAVGNVDHSKLVYEVSRCFEGLSGCAKERVFDEYRPIFATELIKRDNNQVQFCLASSGCGEKDENKYALAVLDTALGGSMSSRLFQELREDRGLAYNVGSFASAFDDCGMFTVYAGVASDKFADAVELCKNICIKTAFEPIKAEEIARSKNLLRGTLLMGLENTSARMNRLAKSEIYGEALLPVESVIEKVMNISAHDILRIAEGMFSNKQFALAAIGDID